MLAGRTNILVEQNESYLLFFLVQCLVYAAKYRAGMRMFIGEVRSGIGQHSMGLKEQKYVRCIEVFRTTQCVHRLKNVSIGKRKM